MATIIEEDYVSFEIAKLLEENGFDNECSGYYNQERVLQRLSACSIKDTLRSPFYFDCIPAPTLQMAMKWLRETHDIDFDINTTGSRHVRRYHIAIWENKDEEMVTINPIGYFNKWEQACEAAIKYCLEHLI